MYDIDTSQAQSPTAVICENAALYGATPAPDRDEFDPRDIWDRDGVVAAIGEAFRILAEHVTPDGFQLVDEREHLLWGIVNTLDAQVRRIDRRIDRLTPQMHDLQSAQDGSEVKARGSNSRPTAPATSATAATPSRPCATPRPNSTAPRPATPGVRGAAATSPRPAS